MPLMPIDSPFLKQNQGYVDKEEGGEPTGKTVHRLHHTGPESSGGTGGFLWPGRGGVTRGTWGESRKAT